MSSTRLFGIGAAAALIVVLALFLALSPVTPAAAQNTACYRAQGGATWACGSGGTMQFLSGSTLTVASGASVNFAPNVSFSQISVSGNITVANFLLTPKVTAVTVTQDSIITPTASLQAIQSAGTVGTGSIAAMAAGTRLTIYNAVNQSITISDTAPLILAGDAALGQYDSLSLVSDGTRWIETGRSNN